MTNAYVRKKGRQVFVGFQSFPLHRNHPVNQNAESAMLVLLLWLLL
jgi:hypothetical protein